MSNLKFKHDVNDYATAKALCDAADGSVLLAWNTWLMKSSVDYEIVHHSTPIITFHPDGSATIDAAYVSMTTANRMHHYKPEMVARIGKRGKDGLHYEVALADHPGTIDIWRGERYRIFPDRTVVKVR